MTETPSTTPPPAEDPRSPSEIIEAALLETEDEAYWQLIHDLCRRGSRDVFDAACALTGDVEARRRELGIDVLAQLGGPGEAELRFQDETVSLLIELLRQESDPEVLAAIGSALGHRKDPRGLVPLSALRTHPNANVRFGVVQGVSRQTHPVAIQTLIDLSSDSDPEVRDWATFGLGSLIDTDTPEIREALLGRLADPNDETRNEALLGLARRRDPRVVEPLRKELTGPAVGTLAVEAAKEIGDRSLHAPLVELKSWWDVDEGLLGEAIKACEPERGEERS